MKIHKLGNKEKPTLMLLPGTFCDWYGNFKSVINLLENDFNLLLVSYSGFEKYDNLEFTSILNEVEKIEDYIIENHNGYIDAIYGSSLGGSLASHIVNRNRIKCKSVILGSSDLDQSSKIGAFFKTKLVVSFTYPIIISGKINSKLTKFIFRNESKASIDKLITVLGGKREWVSKKSCINQFKSDLITKLPTNIDNKETSIYIFYAMKMGSKYLDRYKKYFLKPIIYKQNYKHEELLNFYPEIWTKTIKEIIL